VCAGARLERYSRRDDIWKLGFHRPSSVEMSNVASETVVGRPDPHAMTPRLARSARAVFTSAAGAAAFGALALGATAIGALDIGRLAVGAFAVKGGCVRALPIDDLQIGPCECATACVEGACSPMRVPL
jgi:hypothetical protein